MSELQVLAPVGIGEVAAGADLAALLTGVVALTDGDVVLVTSKVVSKAEGRVVPGSREDLLASETARTVASRGATRIVRTHHGLTLAAAGIDRSNVAPGHVVLLPEDPDRSARRLRAALAGRTGRNVAVLVTDTAGRAWRHGQTDLAVGAAGLRVLENFSGRRDRHGNDLVVTAPAVADELAAAAELVQRKLGERPFAVIRGRADLVLPPGDDGPGAAALVRPEADDLFGFGAREAVVRALRGDPADRAGFGAPATSEELVAALADAAGVAAVPDGEGIALPAGAADREVVAAVAFACGWTVDPADPADIEDRPRLRPGSP